jgi:ABC-type nitrate/sulfonate/bicarbonate transport system substrate-binding protein
MEIQARLILLKYGIDPNTVTYAAMGVGNQRLAALETGTIPAALTWESINTAVEPTYIRQYLERSPK